MTGLCSVTFRHLDVDEIIDFALKAKLNRIEWGADIHVPPGEFETAKSVRQKMEQANLTTTSYGSYFKLGENREYYAMFSSLIETAIRLNAPRIRIWAGSLGSAKVGEALRTEMIAELIDICKLAEQNGINVALEFHRNSLNDNAESCLDILRKADCQNLSTYWQITPNLKHESRVLELSDIKQYLSAIHVYNWGESNIRYALSDADEMWRDYREAVKDLEVDYLLEFVKDDDVEQGVKDAKYLNWLLKTVK